MPGYVRCPKCHKPLPARRAPSTPVPSGGTAVETRGPVPIGAIAIAVAGVLAIVLVFALRGRGSSAAEPAPPPPPPQVGTEVAAPTAPAPAQTAPAATTAPSGGAVANDLERQLKRKRLWSTVEITGDRVDVRSSSCGDPAMAPVVDASRAAFKAAGLTRLRCLEQSGRVVFDRSL